MTGLHSGWKQRKGASAFRAFRTDRGHQSVECLDSCFQRGCQFFGKADQFWARRVEKGVCHLMPSAQGPLSKVHCPPSTGVALGQSPQSDSTWY